MHKVGLSNIYIFKVSPPLPFSSTESQGIFWAVPSSPPQVSFLVEGTKKLMESMTGRRFSRRRGCMSLCGWWRRKGRRNALPQSDALRGEDGENLPSSPSFTFAATPARSPKSLHSPMNAEKMTAPLIGARYRYRAAAGC